MDTPSTSRAARIERRAARRFEEGQADPLAEAGAIIAATAETAENKYLAVSRRKELYLPCSTSESLEYLQGRADGLAALCTALGIETAAPLPPADRDRIIRGLCQGKAPHDHGRADPLAEALEACDGELELND